MPTRLHTGFYSYLEIYQEEFNSKFQLNLYSYACMILNSINKPSLEHSYLEISTDRSMEYSSWSTQTRNLVMMKTQGNSINFIQPPWMKDGCNPSFEDCDIKRIHECLNHEQKE